MKGYSKIKGKTSFIPRSNSNKEFLFVDKDFDNLSSKSNNKKNHLYEQEPSIIVHDEHQDNNKKKKKKKNDFFLGKSEDYDNDDDGSYDHHHSLKSEGGGERVKGVLWRNLSVSSSSAPSYQQNDIKGDIHNNNNYNNTDSRLQRQSSTRAIQDAVKKAFSKKRSSSVNSDRYCRIYDQPMNDDDSDYVYDDHNQHDNNNNNNNDDDDFGKNGSFETRSGR